MRQYWISFKKVFLCETHIEIVTQSLKAFCYLNKVTTLKNIYTSQEIYSINILSKDSQINNTLFEIHLKYIISKYCKIKSTSA